MHVEKSAISLGAHSSAIETSVRHELHIKTAPLAINKTY
jgi:hypothetical protein